MDDLGLLLRVGCVTRETLFALLGDDTVPLGKQVKLAAAALAADDALERASAQRILAFLKDLPSKLQQQETPGNRVLLGELASFLETLLDKRGAVEHVHSAIRSLCMEALLTHQKDLVWGTAAALGDAHAGHDRSAIAVLPLEIAAIALKHSTFAALGLDFLNSVIDAGLELARLLAGDRHQHTGLAVVTDMLLAMIARVPARLPSVWGCVAAIAAGTSQRGDEMALLCAFAGMLFPDRRLDADVRDNQAFWGLIQRGLLAEDPLARKRAMHLLKIVVTSAEAVARQAGSVNFSDFITWDRTHSTELQGLWRDYYVVYDALEETQTHIVLQIIPKVQRMLPGHAFVRLPFSWVSLLLRRMFLHERVRVARLGLLALVTAPVEAASTEMGVDFICGTLVASLNNMYLFVPSQQAPAAPSPLSAALKRFFPAFFAALAPSARSPALRTLVATAARVEKFIPACYLLEVVAAIAATASVGGLDAEGLEHLQTMARNSMNSSIPAIRGSAETFYAKALTLHTDPAISQTPAGLSAIIAALAGCHAGLCYAYQDPVWTALVQWVQALAPRTVLLSTARSVVEAFVTSSILTGARESREVLTAPERAAQIAAFVFLAAAGLDDPDAPMAALAPAFDILQHADRRMYVDQSALLRALALLDSLLQEAVAIPCPLATRVSARAAALADDVLGYIERAYVREPHQLEDIASIEALAAVVLRVAPASTAARSIFAAAYEVVCTAATGISNQLVCMALLPPLLNTPACAPATRAEAVALLDQLQCLHLAKPAAISGNSFGAFAALYTECQWRAVLAVLRAAQAGGFQAEASEGRLLPAIEALGTVASVRAQPVLAVLCVLLQHASEAAAAAVAAAMQAAWQVLAECWLEANTRFNAVLLDATRVAFHATAFRLAATCPAVAASLHDLFARFFSGSETKASILVFPFLGAAAALSGPSTPAQLGCLDLLLDEVVRGCLSGNVLDRFERLVEQTVAILKAQFAETSARDLWAGPDTYDTSDARVARWHATSIILSLAPAQPAHVPIALAVLTRLFQRNRQLDGGTKLFHALTPHHREKIRIWQTVVALSPFVDAELAQQLLPEVLGALGPDNQPSVRYYIEWFLTLLIRARPSLSDDLFTILLQRENRPGYIMSVLTVLSHCTPLILDHPSINGTQHLVRLYSSIIPWLASTHATLRLYAAAILRKNFRSENLQRVEAHGDCVTLRACLHYLSERVDVKKHVDRLLDDFFFARFHPVRDLTCEFIFCVSPQLFGLQQEDCVPVALLPPGLPALPVRIPPEADDCYQGTASRRSRAEMRKKDDAPAAAVNDELQNLLDDADDLDGVIDVQRKLQAGMEVDAGDATQLAFWTESGSTARRAERARADVILVASLIEKPTNLGGLCRTSEIFNIAGLVVGTDTVVKNKEFQVLSRTAEKWLPISVVPPPDLAAWLHAKKREGYTVVAAEQTSNSQSLAAYRFPARTIIVLGREKEGVPVDLIPIMDACIEIPQFGVVRSLNVHVSGALLLWEITRQRIVAGAP
eukprot:m.197382 g.197382  ORF g.197382 m.197382 type:complete len:1527 (-) comp10088_c0_seq29:7556-12136(-)